MKTCKTTQTNDLIWSPAFSTMGAAQNFGKENFPFIAEWSMCKYGNEWFAILEPITHELMIDGDTAIDEVYAEMDAQFID